MGPKLDTLGPFLLEPEIPSASFRKQAGTDHSGASDFSEITGSTAQGETDCDQRQIKTLGRGVRTCPRSSTPVPLK